MEIPSHRKTIMLRYNSIWIERRSQDEILPESLRLSCEFVNLTLYRPGNPTVQQDVDILCLSSSLHSVTLNKALLLRLTFKDLR